MQHIKLFEQFVSSYYSKKKDKKVSPSEIRSQGSINWFTKDEIKQIREGAKKVGIPYIFNSSKKGFSNFFGNEKGIGLKESIANFFRGGDLCSEVHLSTKSGEYVINKRGGEFSVNGNKGIKSVNAAMNLIIK
jgi:hypothetical protein